MSGFSCVARPCDGPIPHPRSHTKMSKVFVVSEVNSVSEQARRPNT